jgi:hypothetical protein
MMSRVLRLTTAMVGLTVLVQGSVLGGITNVAAWGSVSRPAVEISKSTNTVVPYRWKVAIYGETQGLDFNGHTNEFQVVKNIGINNGSAFDEQVSDYLTADVICVGGDDTFSASTAQSIEQAVYHDGKILLINFYSDEWFSESLPAVKAGTALFGSAIHAEPRTDPIVARILEGLPDQWPSIEPGYTRRSVTAKAGATVVTHFADDNTPALVVWRYGTGVVVYQPIELMSVFYGGQTDQIAYQALKWALAQLNRGQVCFSSADFTVYEGTKAKVRVKRIGGSEGVVSVQYKTANKTGLAWQDYTPKKGQVTWTNGDAATKTIRIPITADDSSEGKEKFKVVLCGPGGGATLAAPSSASITIAASTKGGPVAKDAVAVRMTKLTAALDDESLTWFMSEQAPWAKQSDVTVDRVDVAISCTDSSSPSWLQTDLEGSGTLEFDWMLKATGKATCLVYVNGKVRRTLTPGHDWDHETLSLGDGEHLVRWVFVGDSSLTPGAAYLDQVKWTPEENAQ